MGRWSWLNYCFPAGSFSGVKIGIHWSFPLIFVLYAIRGAKYGIWWVGVVALVVFLFYWIIVCHEFGHVFAARREGIGTDRVMLWPLGGLAMLAERATGHTEVRIAAAGPAVNVVFAVLLVPFLAIAGIRLFPGVWHPLDYWMPQLSAGGVPGFGHHVLLGVYKANWILLLFNLIPAFPLDGGRILRGFLYPRHGHVRSVVVTCTISIVFSAALLVVGVMTADLILAAIAVFVGITAWITRRRASEVAAQIEAEEGFMGYDFSMGETSLERGAHPSQPSRRAEKREERERKRREREAAEKKRIEEEVDRLLEKISRSGMESLTRKEKAFLERASRMGR